MCVALQLLVRSIVAITFYPTTAGNFDYKTVDNRALTFSSALDDICIEVNITDDTIVETDEVFQLLLSTDESVVVLPLPAVNVTITDDDGNKLIL